MEISPGLIDSLIDLIKFVMIYGVMEIVKMYANRRITAAKAEQEQALAKQEHAKADKEKAIADKIVADNAMEFLDTMERRMVEALKRSDARIRALEKAIADKDEHTEASIKKLEAERDAAFAQRDAAYALAEKFHAVAVLLQKQLEALGEKPLYDVVSEAMPPMGEELHT